MLIIIAFSMQLSSVTASSRFDLQVVSKHISRVAVVLAILAILHQLMSLGCSIALRNYFLI